MTPAQQLRDAAALLRERAEAATPGPWIADRIRPGTLLGTDAVIVLTDDGSVVGVTDIVLPGDGQYIATVAPPLALAVAAWLDTCAYLAEHGDDGGPRVRAHALDVARVVLGGGADE